MFTGIVEERGSVHEIAPERLVVACRTVNEDSAIGASVAVNGVCLTVVERSPDTLAFDLSAETLSRTSLARLHPGDPVNLERPLTLAARIGGHLMQAHVDGLGEIAEVLPDGAGGATLEIEVPERLRRYIVEKGSIGVDGVSLTVAGADDGRVRIALIPHTLEVTTFGGAIPGQPVNLEVDVISKYVERFLEGKTE